MIKGGNIKGVKIFDRLSEDELENLAKVCCEKMFWKDDIVIKQEEVAESLNILMEGKLQT